MKTCCFNQQQPINGCFNQWRSINGCLNKQRSINDGNNIFKDKHRRTKPREPVKGCVNDSTPKLRSNNRTTKCMEGSLAQQT